MTLLNTSNGNKDGNISCKFDGNSDRNSDGIADSNFDGDIDVVKSLAIPADWDLMFRAVQEKLRLAAQDDLNGVSNLQARGIALQRFSVVRECVNALDQLHLALARERNQRSAATLEISNMLPVRAAEHQPAKTP